MGDLLVIDTRLRRALAALLPEFFPTVPYSCPRRYRVVAMKPSASSATMTRIELQIVNKATGLPDILFVTMAPGLAGSRSELAPGGFVLVEFIDGDAKQPIVTHFATADDPAWKPTKTIIDADELDLGKKASLGVARQTDVVTTLLPPGVFAGTIGGVPATGLIVFATGQTMGNITTASAKVKAE